MKAFLFDMGNVLVHFSHERMCAQIGALCGRTAGEIRAVLIDSGLQWDFERGRFTEAEFHGHLQQLVEHELVLEQLLHAGSNIFELNHAIVPVLDALKSQGHRLVLLSNTSIAHFEFVARNFTVLDRFDDYVVSYRIGALKPDPAIFEAALKAIECPAGECFYTDDIPDYIAAGRKHGLQAEVFTTAQSLVGQLARRGLELELPVSSVQVS